MSKMTKITDQVKIEAYHRLSSMLENVQDFQKKHPTVTYIEFDYYVVHDMILFSIDPEFDFEKLESMIHHVKKSTSAIKRIFNKPIIVLKDTEDVLPVENARIINQNTLLHLANHGQYVSNITKKGVKPRKLLTRIYEDEYGIYENVIFCNYIDDILLMIRKNRRTLNNLLYASSSMKFNLLEKGNHVNYFLALGKLHTGYIRDFNQYFNMSKEMLHQLSVISKAINPRLGKPIYKKNKHRNKKLALKKTNIFLMQKDYRMIYKTYKLLLSNQFKMEDKSDLIDVDLMMKNYLTYVRILTVFAAGHFNFEVDPLHKINMTSLDISFEFKNWKLDIFNNNKKEILMYFNKDKKYKIMLTDKTYNGKTLQNYKKVYDLDEVIVLNPFDENYLERDDVYINMQDIDSFRRIQQIILKGMIYADEMREVCPFCGGKLHKDKYKDFYQCNTCMNEIHEGVCVETKKAFFYTDNSQLKTHAIKKADFKDEDYWYYEKQVESLMYFRNITKINHKGEIVCPHCHKIHEH